MFERVALIGIGLIGSSLAPRHAAGRAGAHASSAMRRATKTRDTALRLGLVSSRLCRRRRRRRAAPISSSSARPSAPAAPLAAGDGAEPEAGRHPDRRRLGQGRGAARCGPARAQGRAFHSRPSRSPAPSIPAPNSGFAELFDGRWCVLTPPEGADKAAVDKLARVLARVRVPRRDHGRAAPRPRARHHQPRAAPHRLQHRQHGAATSGASPTPR